jgi:hypothetical protein
MQDESPEKHDETRDGAALPTALRDAYRDAPKALDPSPLLWRRTRGELRRRGLLRSHRSVWRWGSLAAALAVACFVAGYSLGLSAAAHDTGTTSSAPAATEIPESAVEQVQGAGTAYAAALDSLVRSLGEDATLAELRTGWEVVKASERAQSKAREILLAGSPEVTEASAEGGADPDNVVWF